MNDLDALLKEFEQPTKSNANKSNKQPSGFSYENSQPKKYDPVPLDNRKGNIPVFSSTNPNSEQRRTSILKQPHKSSVDQSFDIDAFLQGRPIQPQQPSKPPHSIAPAKNSAASSRRDSLSDWLHDDRITTKTHAQKVTTNVVSKPAINLNPDDFFSNTNNNNNETKAPYSTTKTSAKQYYLGNSRYKPGKSFVLLFKMAAQLYVEYLGINPRQTVRRDSFNWLTDPSNNSNSASMYFCTLPHNHRL